MILEPFEQRVDGVVGNGPHLLVRTILNRVRHVHRGGLRAEGARLVLGTIGELDGRNEDCRHAA